MKYTTYPLLFITLQNINAIKFQLLIINNAQHVMNPENRSLKLK